MTQRPAQRGLRWQGLFKSLYTEGEGVSGQPPPLQTSPPPLARPMIQARSELLPSSNPLQRGSPPEPIEVLPPSRAALALTQALAQMASVITVHE